MTRHFHPPWVQTIDRFLAKHNLTWGQVAGVGLATLGPFQSYGVLGHTANMPDSFRAEVDIDLLEELITQAWRCQAPRALVRKHDGPRA